MHRLYKKKVLTKRCARKVKYQKGEIKQEELNRFCAKWEMNTTTCTKFGQSENLDDRFTSCAQRKKQTLQQISEK